MKKGFKKFLAMVSIVGLTSGVGALSCAADDKLVAGKQVVYYQLLEGNKLSEDQQKLFDTVKLDGTDYLKVKASLSESDSKLLGESLKILNPFVIIEQAKIVNGVRTFVVVVSSVASAVFGAVAGFVAKMLLSNNQESNA